MSSQEINLGIDTSSKQLDIDVRPICHFFSVSNDAKDNKYPRGKISRLGSHSLRESEYSKILLFLKSSRPKGREITPLMI